MTAKFDSKEFEAEMNRKIQAFLHASGKLLANEFTANSPVITGNLRNSMTYVLNTGETEFAKPPLSVPDTAFTVRAGSPVIYAASVEARGKSAGWMSRVWDRMVSSKALDTLWGKIK